MRTVVLIFILSTFVMAENPWRKTTYPHFTIISSADSEETSDVATQMAVFIQMMEFVMPVDLQYLPPLTIVLFDKMRQLTPYKPLGPDGSPARWIGGYFCSGETGSIIGMSAHFDNERTRKTIFHEAVHWYMTATHRVYPLWFKEGMAEVFSTFEYQKGKISWGQSNDNYINWLFYQRPEPIGAFIRNNSSRVFKDGMEAGAFYAQAWAFVHYLLFNDTEGSFPKKRNFRDSLKILNVYKVFNGLYSEDLDQINTEFFEYISRGSIPHSTVKDIVIADTGYTTVVATDLEIATAMTCLCLGVHNLNKADSLSKSIIALHPDSAVGYDLHAIACVMSLQKDSARHIAEQAIHYNSRNPQTYLLLGQLSLDTTKNISPQRIQLSGNPYKEAIKKISPERARLSADLYKDAIQRYPYYFAAYISLSKIIYATKEKCTQDDLNVLRKGRELFPDVAQIVVGTAVALRFTGGNKDSVYKMIDMAEHMNDKLPALWLQDLDTIKTAFMTEDYRPQIDVLLAQKKSKDAIVLLDQIIEKGEHPFFARKLIAWKNELVEQQKKQ